MFSAVIWPQSNGGRMKLEMPLENQVCTLEQARKFDELGLKLESYFVWWRQVVAPNVKDEQWKIVTRQRWKTKFWTETILPAFSSAEVGMLLPGYIPVEDSSPAYLTIQKIYGGSGRDSFSFEYIQADGGDCMAIGKTMEHEAHAKPDLLLHLFKEKIINPADLSW